MQFEQDQKKAKSNLFKHGVSFEEAKTVFNDPLYIDFYDPDHSENEHRGGKFDKALYRMRNMVERCLNRLKQYRRIATRYEKKSENYLSMLTIASFIMWLQF